MRIVLFILIFCAATCHVFAQQPLFFGPFPSWTNLRSVGARGDGKSDDTRAIQLALDQLGTDNHNVLYIPAGTYRISRTLILRSKTDISIIGESPESVIIQWTGPKDSAMLLIDGATFSKYARITWDGRNTAGTAILQQFDIKGNGKYANTGSEHSEEIFRNCGFGIRTGGMFPNEKYGQDAECTVTACRFYNCSEAGFAVSDWNDLDWFFWSCWFENCGVAMTNDARNGGAGNFHAYYSTFIGSKEADIKLAGGLYFSFRFNTSIRSNRFVQISRGANANGVLATFQGNTIADHKDPYAFFMYTKGNILLLDNVVKSPLNQTKGSVYLECPWEENLPDITMIDNKFTVSNPLETKARIIQSGNTTVPARNIPVAQAVPSAFASKSGNAVFDIRSGTSEAAIFTILDDAFKVPNSVVHFSAGNYNFTKTIRIPASADISIVGDGLLTSALDYKGAGTLLTIDRNAKVRMTDIYLRGTPNTDGLLVANRDAAGNDILLDQLSSNGAANAAVNIDGLQSSRVTLRSYYHYQNVTSSLKVRGAGTIKSPNVIVWGSAGGHNHPSFDLSNAANLIALDTWYEDDQNAHYLRITGKASFTLNGANVAMARAEKGIQPLMWSKAEGQIVISQTIFRIPEGRMKFQEKSKMKLLLLGTFSDRESPNFVENAGAVQTFGMAHTRYQNRGSMPFKNAGQSDATYVSTMLAPLRSLNTINFSKQPRIYFSRVGITGFRNNLTVQSQ